MLIVALVALVFSTNLSLVSEDLLAISSLVSFPDLGANNTPAVAPAVTPRAAVKAAVKDALTQAGANLDEWNAEVLAEAVPDQEADIAVVGGGGAGLAAAIAAGQQGAKVVVIEKNAEVGGDTLVCGAIYNTPNEELQKEVTMTDAVKTTVEKALATEITSEDGKALQAEVQKQWDEYKKSGRTDLFDTKEWYALQTWLGGDQVANLDLVKVLCYNAYDGLQWIEDLGMSFSDKIGQGAGSLWQRTHTSTMQMGTGFRRKFFVHNGYSVPVVCHGGGKFN